MIGRARLEVGLDMTVSTQHSELVSHWVVPYQDIFIRALALEHKLR